MSSSSIDVLIRGARIVDGTGNPWFLGDVAIAGERILDLTAPGRIPPESAREVVDAWGMVVAPGFIDIQSHSILPLMADRRCLSKITQGVTTEIMGEAWTPAPCGGKISGPFSPIVQSYNLPEWAERAKGWRRFGDWLAAMAEVGVSPNVGSFLGGGTLREYARGMAMGESTADDLATMRRVMHEAMDDGAFGVSYALIYPPDCYASTDELVEVAKVAAAHGGVYITHLRSEGDELFEGLDEALAIGRRANVPVEVYHLKAAGRRNWPKIPEVTARIDRARTEGIDVTADMYPYVWAGTGLASLLPPWAAEGGKFFENLRDPATRAKIRAEALNPSGGWEALGDQAGPEGTMPLYLRRVEHQPYVGKLLSDIAAARGQHWLDAAIDLLVAEEQRIFTVYRLIDEANIRLQLQQPWIKISTDAGGVDPAWARSRGPLHPRAYGTYPRVLGKYVRDEKVIRLEDAVCKMSSAVADRLGLRDRGALRPGHYADVIVFDPSTVADRATVEDPHQLSVGIRDVWVNGARVLKNGDHTGAAPGKVVTPR
jgi:dihydroorotase/N-acyl-D-amino-acid deacylase